ncbi:Hypothetical predicted protein [Podarcis lilfordi]|uniref:Uncharacterized protein n=1 Tax=Podarcis lilfordi TaxID=74358 RepID=A0AA35P6R5_9SAUR|nr:Hypothetical predicted protein [Podarcis lilfordi]
MSDRRPQAQDGYFLALCPACSLANHGKGYGMPQVVIEVATPTQCCNEEETASTLLLIDKTFVRSVSASDVSCSPWREPSVPEKDISWCGRKRRRALLTELKADAKIRGWRVMQDPTSLLQQPFIRTVTACFHLWVHKDRKLALKLKKSELLRNPNSAQFLGMQKQGNEQPPGIGKLLR